MVLTDLPFERRKLLHRRYDFIKATDVSSVSSSGADDKSDAATDSKEHAAFLRALERKVCVDGFVDSMRFTSAYSLKKAKSDLPGQPKTRRKSLPENVVDFVAHKQQDDKDYQKRIKIIEDHMWQHKREERELRQTRGDTLKNLQALKYTLRDYGKDVNRKKLTHENKLNQALEHCTNISRDHVRANKELSKERLHTKLGRCQNEKSEGRKQYLTLLTLERQFVAKRAAIELKRSEVKRLNQDFESKLRQKEEEQHKLIRDLADLSHLLNIESQKAKVQKYNYTRHETRESTKDIQDDLSAQKHLEQELKKSNADINDTVAAQRKLDAVLALATANSDIKRREEARRLTDIDILLTNNTKNQVKLNGLAFHADLDLRAKRNEQKVKGTQTYQRPKRRVNFDEGLWEQRFKVHDLESQRTDYEDWVKHQQALVHKEVEQGYILSNRVRSAEYSRQKQDQVVRQLQQNLAQVRRINDKEISQEVIERKNKEDKLHQRLMRERAGLEKVHADREETYSQLQRLQHKVREDSHRLEDLKREHHRLLQIGEKSNISVHL